jgi:hypothetical protein
VADMGAGVLRYAGDKSDKGAKPFGSKGMKPEKRVRY